MLVVPLSIFVISVKVHTQSAAFLSSGFREGFPLHYEGDPGSSDANNLISATENPNVVDAKISKKLKASRLAGPFRARPFYPFQISPLGVVPKRILGDLD